MAIAIAILSLPFATFLFLSLTVISSRRNRKKSVGFFHPYTNDGGGGERVLWCAVRAVQQENPGLECAVFSGDDASPESLSIRARDRFGVELLRAPKVIRLFKRKWIDEKTYPRFTMIGQSLGSVYLTWEALCKYNPEFYFDTSGYAFTYPLARLFGCKVICYTHYPTISSDMVARVTGRSSMYNNDPLIAKRFGSDTFGGSNKTQGKPTPVNTAVLVGNPGTVVSSPSYGLAFWVIKQITDQQALQTISAKNLELEDGRLTSWLYGLVGSCAHLAMVNSSWTGSHIEKLWKIPSRTRRVYPPCDTSSLQMLPLERPADPPIFISVAQFRPEKAHGHQLEAFALALERLSSESESGIIKKTPKLQFVGSCRNKDDENRLQKLKERSTELHLDDFVEFHSNVLYRDLVKLLGGAIAGLHSMVDEHFGISVVEYMAAGAIPIAHNSAGPRMDIVLEEDGQQTGFLANTIEEYAHAIIKVLTMSDTARLRIASSARNRAQRFSEQRFDLDIKDAIRPLFAGA